MEISVLKMFVKVAAFKSFSKAAVSLDMVQSHISTKIQQLEKEIGSELFIRHNKGVELTGQGELLLNYAQKILRLVEEALNAVNSSSQRGILRIGTMQTTAQTFLPSILSEFHRIYPDYRLKISADSASSNLEGLFRYENDFSFVAGDVNSDAIKSIPLTEERLAVISSKPYDSIEEYFIKGESTLITFPAGCAYRRHTEKWLSSLKITLKNIIECNSIPAIVASAAAGMGVAVLPEHTVSDSLTKGVLYANSLSSGFETIALNLCYRDDLKLNDAMHSFVKICQNSSIWK